MAAALEQRRQRGHGGSADANQMDALWSIRQQQVPR
jgi:hypothetical protein